MKKIDLFDGFDDKETSPESIEDEIISVKFKANSDSKKNRFSPKGPIRTREEYMEYVVSTYTEEHTNAAGEVRVITVDVLKPEINPFELLRPAYAYGQF